MRKALVSWILVASCTLACRPPPRMDTRSPAAFRASSEGVAAALPGADAERFRSALGLIAALDSWERYPSLFARALALGPTPVAPPSGGVMKRVHGLTGAEVIALADQLAAETQRIHGLSADDVIAVAHKVATGGRTVISRTEAAYFRRLEIRGLKVEYVPRIEVTYGRSKGARVSPSLGAAFRTVAGDVKNVGDKPLDTAEVTLALLDARGKPLAGYSHLVVLNKFDPDGALAPFKPGDARGFSWILDESPPGWTGKVEARITAVKFTEPE
jgi:hypothetical protein